MMAPGTHTYNFVCVLPVGLPTSFEGKHGHIRYLVRLKMDRPWKFDHVFKTPFTVLRNIDLNQNLALRVTLIILNSLDNYVYFFTIYFIF